MPGEESDSGGASSQGASLDQIEALLARHQAQQKAENERAIQAGIAAGLAQAGATPSSAPVSEPVAKILARQRADDIKADWRKSVRFRGQDPAGATAVQMQQLADIGAEGGHRPSRPRRSDRPRVGSSRSRVDRRSELAFRSARVRAGRARRRCDVAPDRLGRLGRLDRPKHYIAIIIEIRGAHGGAIV